MLKTNKKSEEEILQLICDQIDHFNSTGKLPVEDQMDKAEVKKMVYDNISSDMRRSWSLYRYFGRIGITADAKTKKYIIPKKYVILIDELWNKKIIDKENKPNRNVHKKIQYKFINTNIKIRKIELSIIAAYYSTFLNKLLSKSITYELLETRKKNMRNVDYQYEIIRDFKSMFIELVPKNPKRKVKRIEVVDQALLKVIITNIQQSELPNYFEQIMVNDSIKGEAADMLFWNINDDENTKIKNQLFYLFTGALYDYIYRENIITRAEEKFPVPEICQFIVDFYCGLKLDTMLVQKGKQIIWEDSVYSGLYKVVWGHIKRHKLK